MSEPASAEKPQQHSAKGAATESADLLNLNVFSLPQSIETSQFNRRTILQLQRLVGNRNTRQLVQRQNHSNPPVDPISWEQARAQVQWYEQRANRFTPDIIRQIQTHVLVMANGTPSSDMVMGVARFQASHNLFANGLANTDTLAAMFDFGLAQEGQMDAFSNAMSSATTITSPAARFRAIQAAVDARFREMHIPRCLLIPTYDLPPENGAEFQSSDWTIRLRLSDTTISDYLYHEMRHAEQFFREARVLAGRRVRVSEIANQLHVPEHVAEAARQNPLLPGSAETLVAEGWLQADANQPWVQDVYTERMAATAALRRAQTQQQDHPSPQNQRVLQQAQQRADRANAAYQNLPHESDAYRQEARFSARARARTASTSP